ncbi:4'-phosphopantetheinyl transferase superfamily protein [Streptomyces bathyalis]|uniref:4'-phosphopantetheinyl transferase superfamily protein n=1 Tax=Streptomyces bathyalis TaxID=2710756 RepID=A0A7T1T3M6_9ACTN|nr:4'-phosphopantetheinyl transferase superfamily protein [Streptomyces bathyalis]QPP05791.1 4'-phosphopantetheinyl transferase superfamily protein [Streptomyces bathyalis]
MTAGPAPSPAPAAPETVILRVSGNAARATRELEWLSQDERSRAAAFRRQEDRDRYHVAHTALRRELARRTNTAPSELPLVRADCPVCGGPHGRPGLAGDPLHFSLSHAGDLVLLAFAAAPVGVDVESLPGPGVVEEVSRTLHPREQDELGALPPQQRPAAFARCWTRKEAYVKGTGSGLGEEPSVTYVGTSQRPASPPGWTIGDLDVATGYAAAWALRRS